MAWPWSYLVAAGGALRHPLHLAPALERSPQAAIEAEAVDRRRARQRADACQAGAGPLEAALLQHAARRRVGDASGRLQRVAFEVGEGVVDHRAHRLGGVALAPMLDAEPVADLWRMPVDLREAAGADHRLVPLPGERDEEDGLVGGSHRGDEVLGIGEPVRMRNACRVLGDAAVVRQRGYDFSVPKARRAQHEPRGLEDGDTPLAKRSCRYFL